MAGMLAAVTLLLLVQPQEVAGARLQPLSPCRQAFGRTAVGNLAALGMVCAAVVQTLPSACLLSVPAALLEATALASVA